MKTLETLLGESPHALFLPKHFTRLPFARPGGAKELTHLLSWDKVQKIIDSKKSVLRIVQDGRVIKDYVDLTFLEARAHHEKGHTLLLRFAEKADAELMKVAQDFSRSFHTPVDVQLYCTPQGHNAFGWHYDVEEVFIIQARGSKTYSIRQNTVHPNPLVKSIPKDLGYEQEKSELEIKVTLEEGDFLYIPSGWWHIARTQKESMHISIGLMPNAATEIASFLPEYLAREVFWRVRMPVHQEFPTETEEISFYRDAFTKLAEDLGKKVQSEEFIRDFLRWKRRPS